MTDTYPARAPPVISVNTKPEHQYHKKIKKGEIGTRGRLASKRNFWFCAINILPISSPPNVPIKNIMEFFSSAVTILQTLVVAIGAGLGVWGVINLMEGYGNDNPGAKSQGMKQLMAGGGVILIGTQLIPLLGSLF